MENIAIETQNLELIKGEFSVLEAKELLFNLINQKINFHNLRDWSSQERYGMPDENSVQRIQQLKQSKESLQELVQIARKEGLSFKIDAKISIELV